MNIDDAYTHEVGTFGKCQLGIVLLNYAYAIITPPQYLVVVFIGSSPAELNASNNRVDNQSSFLIEWSLMDRQWIRDLIQSFWFLGFLLGVVFFGQLSDRYGRRITMLAGFHIFFPVCLLTSFAYSWQTFSACRLITGFLCGGVRLVQYVYTQEMLGKEWWKLNSLLDGSMFGIGIALVSTIAYFVPNWRNLVRLLSIMQIPFMLCLWLVPESPRWLYSQGCLDAAEAVLVKVAKRNGKVKPVVRLVKRPEKVESSYTLVDVFRNRITRKRSLVLQYLWFVASFVVYALILAAGEFSENLYLSEALPTLFEYPTLIFLWVVLGKPWCGRKRALVTAFLLGGCSCIALVGFDPADRSKAKMAVGLSGRMFVSAAFSILYLYSSELFPTCVRNIAMGSLSFCARIGGILASFSKSMIVASPVLSYLTFGACGATAGCFALSLPETLGQPLPEKFGDLCECSRAQAPGSDSAGRTDEDDNLL